MAETNKGLLEGAISQCGQHINRSILSIIEAQELIEKHVKALGEPEDEAMQEALTSLREAFVHIKAAQAPAANGAIKSTWHIVKKKIFAEEGQSERPEQVEQ